MLFFIILCYCFDLSVCVVNIRRIIFTKLVTKITKYKKERNFNTQVPIIKLKFSYWIIAPRNYSLQKAKNYWNYLFMVRV